MVLYNYDSCHLLDISNKKTIHHQSSNFLELKSINEWISIFQKHNEYPTNTYLLKFNNRNTRKRYEICSKSIIKTTEDVTDVFLLFLLLTLTYFTPFPSVSIVDSEQVNVCWEIFDRVLNMLTYFLLDLFHPF